MIETAVWHITAFYRFIPIEEAKIAPLRTEILGWMGERNMRGLVLVSCEGVNGTVAGTTESIEQFKTAMCDWVGTDDIRFKDSTSDVRPFRRLTVDVRKEIVTLKRPDLVPEITENSHLSPKEWHEMLSSENPPVLIDTRNTYETLTGKFKGAIDPQLKTFADWNTYLNNADLPKDQPVMIYCTGGIRCEKAIMAMHTRGFEKVYQLRDGILGYLAEYPNQLYEGDCYIFDERVGLDQNLQPSTKFGNCPGCGLTAEGLKECSICGKGYYMCPTCAEKWPPTCCKRCRDTWRQQEAKRKRAEAPKNQS